MDQTQTLALEEYQRVFKIVRDLLNEADPEGEYEMEAMELSSFLIHNQKQLLPNPKLLSAEIARIWMENFGSVCRDSDLITERILKKFKA